MYRRRKLILQFACFPYIAYYFASLCRNLSHCYFLEIVIELEEHSIERNKTDICEGTASNPIWRLSSMMLFIFWVNRRVTSGALELSILGVLRPKDAFRIECEIVGRGGRGGGGRINCDKYRSKFCSISQSRTWCCVGIVEYEITRETIYKYIKIFRTKAWKKCFSIKFIFKTIHIGKQRFMCKKMRITKIDEKNLQNFYIYLKSMIFNTYDLSLHNFVLLNYVFYYRILWNRIFRSTKRDTKYHL